MPTVVDSEPAAVPFPPERTGTRRVLRPRRWRIGLIMVFVGALVAVGGAVVQYAYWGPKSSVLLTAQGSSRALFWVDDRDAADETRTVDANGTVTRSVPMRKGLQQGVIVLLTNVSAYDVVIEGPQAPTIFAVQASTADVVGTGDWKSLTFADRVTVPAGAARYLKIMTAPNATCVPYSRGSGLVLSDVGLLVSTRLVRKINAISSADHAILTSQSDTTPPGCVAPDRLTDKSFRAKMRESGLPGSPVGTSDVRCASSPRLQPVGRGIIKTCG